MRAPHDDLAIPGDLSYAPPELLYGASSLGWQDRLTCDLYLLGSLISSMFTSVAMTPLILMGLSKQHRHYAWRGTYAEVLPFLQSAFSEVLAYVGAEVPAIVRPEITTLLSELCEPDPTRRAHPRSRQGSPVPRYVTRFDYLARLAAARIQRP